MRRFANALALIAFVALGYWSGIQVWRSWYQLEERERFTVERNLEPRDSVDRSANNSPALTLPSHPPNGSVIGMLSVPRLGISNVILEGSDEPVLRLGPGHVSGTQFPGQGGNVALAGHRDTFFRPLRNMRIDDMIQLLTAEHEYSYRVVSTEVVDPADVRVLYSFDRETVTLITCYPFNFIGSAPKRFIVRADLVD